jgi:menaquinone-dependent protoporphyrinogen IX oxidase
MRVLVTAATRHGATAEIAAANGEVLADRGLDPTVVAPEQVKGVDGTTRSCWAAPSTPGTTRTSASPAGRATR